MQTIKILIVFQFCQVFQHLLLIQNILVKIKLINKDSYLFTILFNRLYKL